MTNMSQIALVISSVILVVSAENGDNLMKLWSVRSSTYAGGARTAVLNVSRGSIDVQPSSYTRQARMPAHFAHEYRRYAFKPRAIPLNKEQPEDRSLHYVNDNTNQHKSEILLPGNYFPIADVKRDNATEETFNPLAGGKFHPKIIPLIRSEEYQRRSLENAEEPIIETPDEFAEPAVAERRSISSLIDDFGEEDDSEDDADLEEEDDDELASKHHPHKPKRKGLKKRLGKYMLPLLLAYKMKFFSLVPLMMGGLILLVGATGMAGFFFALFAAVMGLQKGSY